MRKVGIAIALIVVLLVAAALIVPHVVNINFYHNQIQAELQKKLGREISLGQMGLSLFPPSFQVNNAIIGEDRSFPPGHPFAIDRKSTRLNSSHDQISYAVFCLKKKAIGLASRDSVIFRS